MQVEEYPQDGIAGLRHWRYGLGAGLQVSLVSSPLSPGIAVASGTSQAAANSIEIPY
jgi:carbonic anhydrase